ncbi:UNVERIFIED_CONTAM: hypothetical protein GTU68_043381 [Idotea baltica]|nr:hypothetical protein [Idotea baltica]
MSAICFVCNLPILSHQVGLVWEGGNGYDDVQSEQSTPRTRYVGRRDSSAQITPHDPPTEIRETSPPTSRRRRSSLAQLTDILKDWGRKDSSESRGTRTTSTGVGRRESKDFSRRESLSEIARNLHFTKRESSTIDIPGIKARRESSAEIKKRRQSGTDLKGDLANFLARRESVTEILKRRRDSIEKEKKERRDSTTQVYPRPKFERSTSPDKGETFTQRIIYPSDTRDKDLSVRPIVTTQASADSQISQVSLISQISTSCPDPQIQEPRSSVTSPVPTSPTPSGARRDSNTQLFRGRRDARPQASPERGRGSREPSPSKLRGLRRQSTPHAYEEGLPLPDCRRGSRPFLSPDANEIDSSTRKYRRDSLSPDSAAAEEVSLGRKGRRDSRPHLSPEASDSNSRETSPRCRLRRQSTTAADYLGRGRRSSRSPRSPDSSSTCSSREHSPKERGLRRQSTTEEILIARGFRRQSTTEDIMRARNFRRQSTQSEEMSKSRGRRDSCAQITDGTIDTMTIETSCAFFDTSTQTGI